MNTFTTIFENEISLKEILKKIKSEGTKVLTVVDVIPSCGVLFEKKSIDPQIQ